MKRRALISTIWLALAAGACDEVEPKATENARAQAERSMTERLKAACSSQATYNRIKQVAFEEAIRIRNADPVNLDTLSTHSMVRVENPVVKSRDEVLDVTVCSGRFILHVPPGAERAFDGQRQLVADIEYAAQAAADGSGLVYQLKGAEPIIYRLAAFDLRSEAYRPPASASSVTVAARQPEEAPEPVPAPTPVRVAEPARTSPRPTPSATPAPPAAKAIAAPAEPARRANASSPSFNCRVARSRSERMVCGSDHLASLDRQMSSQFYSELSRSQGAQRAELRRTRDEFLRYRERCGDEQCVEEAYIGRMNEIRDIAANR